MVTYISFFKNALWFLAVVILALSFPLQVYVSNPYPSLIPYALISLILFLSYLQTQKNELCICSVKPKDGIRFIVLMYVFLVVLSTLMLVTLELITFYEGFSAWTIYLLPAIFYWYFRSIASEQEIRYVLLAIVLAAVIVGLYFAYDSYLKLALNQVSDYANAAFQYSLDRSNQKAEEANAARISTGSRSMGLLQHHSVSGAWVILGAFAALALLPREHKSTRFSIIFIFGTMLLLGLNFTSILAFFFILFVFEFGGLVVLSGRVVSAIRGIAILAVIFSLLIAVSLSIVGEEMASYMLRVTDFQKNLLFGSEDGGLSMLGLVIENINRYIEHLFEFPVTLIFGDGFSSFGMLKGGDIGLIETLAKFGMPLFSIILFGMSVLVKSGLQQILASHQQPCTNAHGIDRNNMLQFAICITLLILITEGHYSIWSAKSILPVFFFSLALYERYLPANIKETGSYSA